ncbi:MAG TPA: phosphate ABC transporter substrate-binding/OmpA family protein [Chitinophagales bacterium]|nr:phosphate ABC transporter substrate-binding/OmpA family protein [Chitinophagales bacterium]HRK27337.1 phosphate ABC transporter substrate-binding/OmpA family protein [Chitinophagales bacterium]
MATRLTGFSKFLITLLIVGGIGGGLYYLANNTEFGKNANNNNGNNSGTTGTTGKSGNNQTSDPDVIKVGVVTWGGYAGGQYFNEGFNASENSRYYKDYGIKVEFIVLDDFAVSREAFKADEVNLLWATVDAFPTEVGNMKEFEPQIVFQADWSRGGDAIVARRGINSVADLKGKKIAVALKTPSHSFLLWLLEAGDLKSSDVEIVEAPSAIDAAAYFKANRVDAAVVWSPDDDDCVNSVKGSKILRSTKSASHIIADVFIAKKAYAEQNKEKLQKLFEGWMRGAAEINANDASKRKAAKILADGLNMPEDYCYNAINNVRLCTYGDNVNFFNLNGNYTGVKGEDLYNKMTKTYQSINKEYAQNVPAWRLVANPAFIRSTTSLTGKEHLAEGAVEFKPPTQEMETAPAISSKKVTINFDSGSSTLSENAKQLIDIQFSEIAKAFGNARIRIEGNTDNVGNREQNITLSKRRAQAVADYLAREYKMDPNRFVVVGNGPDKPVADNNTPEGKAKNRRTDFDLLAD